MSISTAQQTYLLSETENQLIFLQDILPDAFDETSQTFSPKAIFLGGQSGSGKSDLALAMQQSFSEVEGVVIVNSDALREYHPNFLWLQKNNPDQASFLVNPDTFKWQQKLIAATVESGRNLILDGTLGGDSAPILQTMKQLKTSGYSVQLSILAVPARLSRLGIYKHYED
ncbi:MAG: zeta toxin family protein, partial [Rudanella sp.]|nr:zeta toxin family protein [Rudanella sp.]